MTKSFCAIWALGLMLFLQTSALAQADEPPIPPGLDPGGIAVALLGTGVDYTQPELAAKLARDGEGDLIAWDFTDNDTRPYAADGASNTYALALLGASDRIRLIVVKQKPGDPVAIGRMAAFAAQTPARIIYCPDAMQREDWPVFKQAVALFKDRMFVVVQHGEKQPELAVFPNLIVVPTGELQHPQSNAVIALANLAKLLMDDPTLTVPKLKAGLATLMR